MWVYRHLSLPKFELLGISRAPWCRVENVKNRIVYSDVRASLNQGSGAIAAWASDETFHCDRESITIKRIPWLDFPNRGWRTYTYPLADVNAIRFAVIASAKGSAFWGLRFRAHGRKWALPGLEAPEAKQILTGLRALGADVPDDPRLAKRIKEALEMRFGDTSWMDSSWMDPNKH